MSDYGAGKVLCYEVFAGNKAGQEPGLYYSKPLAKGANAYMNKLRQLFGEDYVYLQKLMPATQKPCYRLAFLALNEADELCVTYCAETAVSADNDYLAYLGKISCAKIAQAVTFDLFSEELHFVIHNLLQ